MTGDKPKVFASAKHAWSDVFRAISAMPALILGAVALGLAFGALDVVLTRWTGRVPETFGALAVTIVVRALWAFLLTPLYLAIHRFIILDERAPRYALNAGQPRFQRFFLCTLAIYALWIVPSLATVTLGQSGAGLALSALLMLIGLFISTRLIILFPAIAVDAPGTGFRNAYDDTQGSFWRIFAIVLITMLPITAVVVAAVLKLGEFSIVARLSGAVLSILNVALAIAVASRLYLALGVRVGRPGSGAVEFGTAGRRNAEGRN
jgi:hypothetical protein